MKTELATAFEWEVCSRCGGSGSYSYNQMDGSRCFGCSGAGYRLTKRGAAASLYLRNMLMAEMGSLKIGDLVQCDDLGRRYFAPVVEIVRDTVSTSSSLRDGVMVPNPPSMRITMEHARYGRFSIIGQPSHKVRKGADAETKQKAVSAAVAYQSTLTKMGKPMKRKAMEG